MFNQHFLNTLNHRIPPPPPTTASPGIPRHNRFPCFYSNIVNLKKPKPAPRIPY